MYYALIYDKNGSSVLDIEKDASKITSKLVELRKQHIHAYIQYHLNEIILNGKAIQ